MTSILDKPAKVDRDGERLCFYAPGEVCVDICSGTPEDRKRVMALLEHVQRMARILIRYSAGYGGHDCRTTPEECSICKPIEDVLVASGASADAPVDDILRSFGDIR